MVTTKLQLTQQTDGDFNWDDAFEANWVKIDSLLTLSGIGSPAGNVAGTFVGQRYFDSLNRLSYACVGIGAASAAIWVLDDGALVGEIKTILTGGSLPAGWLAMNGQVVAAVNYPLLALALQNTPLVSIISGTLSITLPDLTVPVQLVHRNAGSAVGVLDGNNNVGSGGGHTVSGTTSTAGGHNHGGITGTDEGIAATLVGQVNEQEVSTRGHQHNIASHDGHQHTFSDTVAPHTHSLDLRKLTVRVMIKAF